jgi:hypothetical protein
MKDKLIAVAVVVGLIMYLNYSPYEQCIDGYMELRPPSASFNSKAVAKAYCYTGEYPKY